jgi:hypothetical protein
VGRGNAFLLGCRGGSPAKGKALRTAAATGPDRTATRGYRAGGPRPLTGRPAQSSHATSFSESTDVTIRQSYRIADIR